MATEAGDVISFQVPVDMLNDLMYEDEIELDMGNGKAIGIKVNEIIPIEDKQLAVVSTVLWIRDTMDEAVSE